jgi:hypothetical protein
LGGRSSSGISGDKTEDNRGGLDYWIVKLAVTNTTLTASARESAEVETSSAVPALGVSPNPFSTQLTINFSLPQPGPAVLKVYNELGLPLETLYEGEVVAGKEYTVEWQATNHKAGMYIIRLGSGKQVSHQKVILVR